MEEMIQTIKKTVGESDDFIYKQLYLNHHKFYLIFNEVLTSTELINNFILRAIRHDTENVPATSLLSYFSNVLPDNNVKPLTDLPSLLEYLCNGFTILVFEDGSILSIETRANLDRGIATAESETSIQGPKDAFSETYNVNLGLIRRRIKSEHLWTKTKTLGKLSKTKVGILYMENIIEDALLQEVEKKLEQIDIDGILDSGYLKEQLEQDTNNFFPTVMATERPDRVSQALLEGKIAILVDTSPYVLILPSFFIDFLHTTDDYYQKPINITFIRVIRLLAFLIAIFIPAYYIAVTTHNHDAIPLNLLINFTIQRESVPFPALLEAFLMSISFEILRESDTRMPSNMGTAVSILGGLVLGEAAVSAGIVSPIMIIVIAISAISGLVFSSIELISAVRWWRFLFMILATFFGIYGIFLGGICFVAKLASLESFGKPYLAPFAPMVISQQKDALVRTKRQGVQKRNPLLTKKNKIRGRL